MVKLLLATKLFLPLPSPDAIFRPRLFELLNQSSSRKLTLISAPPGFGKTTLLIEWHALNPAFGLGWLALDEADNEGLRFWTYFVAAVQRVHPEVGQEALATLQSLATTPPSIETVLAGLINEIAALPSDSSFGVVLDDYHVITNLAIHQALTFLLDRLPPQLRLFITSRADPLALPLSRLRVRGELTELRVAQLRFTLEEALSFFRTRNGLTLSDQDIERLATRTEGWVAGLQLAALSLQDYDPDQAHQFVETFAGNDRYIVDYLLEEVLQRQPPRLQAFLLETSLLDRLTAPLCEAVTGQQGAAMILHQLEKNNLFVVPLDNRREWYRYHHLFAELLSHHLSQTYTQTQINELNLRASQWFEQNKQPSEAVNYALAAHSFDRAADLIEPLAEELTVTAQLLTLKKWYSQFPASLWQSRPYLAMSYAWVLMLTGESGKAENFIRLSYEALETEAGQNIYHPANLMGQILILQTHLASQRGDIARTLELGEKAIGLVSTANAGGASGVSSLALVLARNQLENKDARAAEENFRKAVELGKRAGNLYTAVSGIVGLADLQMLRGNLRQAEELLRQGLDLAKPSSSATTLGNGKAGKPLPAASEACSHLSELLMEWNQLEEAEEKLTWGQELAPYLQNSRMLLYNALLAARLAMAKGSYSEAQNGFEATEQLADKLGHPAFKELVRAYQARLWLIQDRVVEAGEWAKIVAAVGTANRPSLKFWPVQTTLARVWLAVGEIERVQELLEASQAKADEWLFCQLEVQLLQALLWQARGNWRQAIQTLSLGLTLAAPAGFIRLYVDAGPSVAALLQQIVNTDSTDIPRSYLEKLLGAFPASFQPATEAKAGLSDSPVLVEKKVALHQAQFIEIPSERELEVLRLIAAGLSNQEIADKLVVSPNTIKAHINKIYSKLIVNSRTQAILRARELNLL
jgi:LuxR family maltose regulon positive regulatory protein